MCAIRMVVVIVCCALLVLRTNECFWWPCDEWTNERHVHTDECQRRSNQFILLHLFFLLCFSLLTHWNNAQSREKEKDISSSLFTREKGTALRFSFYFFFFPFYYCSCLVWFGFGERREKKNKSEENTPLDMNRIVCWTQRGNIRPWHTYYPCHGIRIHSKLKILIPFFFFILTYVWTVNADNSFFVLLVVLKIIVVMIDSAYMSTIEKTIKHLECLSHGWRQKTT